MPVVAPKMSIFKFPEPVHMLLHSKAESSFKMELRLLISWPWWREIILDNLEGSNIITRIFKSANGRQKKRSEIRRMWCKNSGHHNWLWRWRKGIIKQMLQAACESWKRQENRFLHKASRKECRPANTLILFQWEPWQTSNIENRKIINLCWSKPLILWQFVKAK